MKANPNDLLVMSAAGVATMHCGDLDEALRQFHRALALTRHDPDRRFALTGLAMIAIIRGDYHAALDYAAQSLAHNDRFDPTYWMLAAANAYLGRMEEAKSWREQLQALVPGITVSRIRKGQISLHPDRIGAVLEGLRRAGLAD